MQSFPSAEEILQVFEGHPEKTFRLRELVQELGLRSSQARQLKSALKELSKRRKILYLKKNHFVLADRHDSVKGRARITNVADALAIPVRLPACCHAVPLLFSIRRTNPGIELPTLFPDGS